MIAACGNCGLEIGNSGLEIGSFGPVGCPACSPYRTPYVRRMRWLYRAKHGKRW